jgi:hypothetical protein
MNTAWLKSHWYYALAGVVGIIVLYELVKKGQGGAASPSGDLSGGGIAQQNLVAAADLQNAQTNAVITQAAYAANVANNQTVAQLKATEVETAAKLMATQQQTEAAREVQLAGIHAGVEMQSIVTSGHVAEVQIEGSTITNLAKIQADVSKTMLNNVAKQVSTIQTYSKHASQDYASIAPVLAIETGQGGAAAAIGTANAQSKASQTASVAGGIAKLGSSLISGLFGMGG